MRRSHRGKVLSAEHKAKIADALRGKKKSQEHSRKIGLSKKGIRMSDEARLKMSRSHKGIKYGIETRLKKSAAARRGAANNKWKGGITPLNTVLRQSLEYKLWCESIFARDSWTCQACGERGGNLQADHIKPFSLYPELRLALDNGRTLCVACHKKTPSYLKNSFTRETYEQLYG